MNYVFVEKRNTVPFLVSILLAGVLVPLDQNVFDGSSDLYGKLTIV